MQVRIRLFRNPEIALAVGVPFVLYGLISIGYLLLVLPLVIVNLLVGSDGTSLSSIQAEFLIGATIASLLIVLSLACLAYTLEKGVAFVQAQPRGKFIVTVGILGGCVLAGTLLASSFLDLWPLSIIFLASPGFSIVIGIRTIVQIFTKQL